MMAYSICDWWYRGNFIFTCRLEETLSHQDSERKESGRNSLKSIGKPFYWWSDTLLLNILCRNCLLKNLFDQFDGKTVGYIMTFALFVYMCLYLVQYPIVLGAALQCWLIVRHIYLSSHGGRDASESPIIIALLLIFMMMLLSFLLVVW